MDLQDFLDVIDPEMEFGLFVDMDAYYSNRATAEAHMVALHDGGVPPSRVRIDSIEVELNGELTLLAHYLGRY